MTHLIEQWRRPKHVVALQTTRSFNNLDNFSAHPAHMDSNTHKQLIESFALPHEPKFLQQVHANQVVEYVQQPQSQLQIKADACFTRSPHVICAIMTADCLPVLLTDTQGSFIAAVHCGWRSLYANILPATLAAIQPTQEVTAWFGPCIQQPQYEVSADFVTHYLDQHPGARSAFSGIIDGKSHASLYQLATIQLHQLGVRLINKDDYCTFNNPAYHSWRESQTKLRMATMAWLSPTNQVQ